MIRKILVISAFPPCQKTAGQDYTRRFLFDLIDKGYKVDLIYAEYPGHKVELPIEVNVLKVIHPSLKNCIKKIYVHPFFSKRYDVKTRKLIQNVAKNYDMLYFDFTQVHFYSHFVKHPCKIMMCHDVICQKYSRKTGKINVQWIKYWEKNLLLTSNQGFTFSKKDSQIIREQYGIDTFPVNFYLKTGNYRYREDQIVTDKMCFYGAWNRPENVEAIIYFIEKILPKLTRKRKFEVIGGGMESKLKDKLVSLGFECLGFVEDPMVYLAECQALVAPLHQGAGVKVKVVDSLTVGLPIIGTDVAFEGIEDNIENHLFHRVNTEYEFIKTLDNWKNVNKEYKQNAANEFYKRYSGNHFPEYIDGIEKNENITCNTRSSRI